MSCYELFYNTYMYCACEKSFVPSSAVHTQLVQATTKFREFATCARPCAISNVHMYSFGLISPILSHLYLDSKAGIAQSAERLGNGLWRLGVRIPGEFRDFPLLKHIFQADYEAHTACHSKVRVFLPGANGPGCGVDQ